MIDLKSWKLDDHSQYCLRPHSLCFFANFESNLVMNASLVAQFHSDWKIWNVVSNLIPRADTSHGEPCSMPFPRCPIPICPILSFLVPIPNLPSFPSFLPCPIARPHTFRSLFEFPTRADSPPFLPPWRTPYRYPSVLAPIPIRNMQSRFD